ncbi:MAG TPA: HAMP domain-containing sensor histidine kinase [Candidatus Eisenbacteria bacterium]|nr:HAMP domain-containing sensor histidine kinase [Candidatus Eisenbacteria bacterium]
MLLTSAGLTAASLLIVQRSVENQVRHNLQLDLANSVETFRNFQKEREESLARSAELMADLPVLKALMTSRHAPTIQDASAEMFRLSGGDLFALVDQRNQIVGFHTRSPGITLIQAQSVRERKTTADSAQQWWFAGGHLYEVFLAPIYFGPQSSNSVLGTVAIGYEINENVAHELARVASGQVAVVCAGAEVVSTVDSSEVEKLQKALPANGPSAGPLDVKLGPESFVVSSLALNRGDPLVTIYVMKSYDQAAQFLSHLRQFLLAVGLGAVLLGSLLVYVLASTFTRPLDKLVEGVRALEKGDYAFPLDVGHDGEVGEVTKAFARMRENLQRAQQRLLHSERLATIGTMASSISHDLRHPLTAVLANAEFLAEPDLPAKQREELYLEIRVAVHRLTDLIDSLLELSRPAEALSLTETAVEHSASRAIELIHAHPEFQKVKVGVASSGVHFAMCDPRKMERVFYNLLLNSCQSVQASGGHVSVTVENSNGQLEIRIIDDGPGLDPSIRDKVFHPFVSHGKENGTGLGLTIAQKIVQDHSGQLQVEESAPGRTVMLITLLGVNPMLTAAGKMARRRDS